MVLTINERITAYLKNRGWVSGMEIESQAYEWRSKRIGRTLRDMSSGDYPQLEKSYTNDKHHAVQYRLPAMTTAQATQFLEKLKQEEQGALQI
jgi:uncharacterized protein HemY